MTHGINNPYPYRPRSSSLENLSLFLGTFYISRLFSAILRRHPLSDALSQIFRLHIVRQQSSIPLPHIFLSVRKEYGHRFLSLFTLPYFNTRRLHSDDTDRLSL